MSLCDEIGKSIEEMAPQMTVYANDFKLDYDDENELAASKFVKDGTVVMEQPSLIIYKLKSTYGAVSKETGRLVYYVQVKKNKSNLLGKYVTQVAVWRDDTSLSSTGLASWIFRMIILKETGIIVSDGVQTDQGRRFWSYQVKSALDKNLYVYALDFYQKVLHPIENEVDFRKYASRYYGDDPKYRDYRFVISDKPLNI